MKKIYRIITLGFCLFIINLATTTVFAAELKSNVTNKTNENGELRLPILLSVGEDEQISLLKLSCTTDSDDVTCSFEAANNVKKTENTFIYIGNNEDLFPKGDTEIAYLILKNSTTTKISNLHYTVDAKDGSGNDIGGLDSHIEVSAFKEKSGDATLGKLTVSQGTLTPAFSSDVTSYTVYKIADTINSLTLGTDCGVSGCDIEIFNQNGESLDYSKNLKITLNQGSNVFTIGVTSENGVNTKEYTINIIRGETGFNSAKLKLISFGEYTMTPAFSSDVLEYTLTVPYSITSLVNVIYIEKEDENATETLDGLENLVVGNNKATITIDSVLKDAQKTYIINVIRLGADDIEVLKYKNNEVTFRDSEGIQQTLNEEEFKVQYPNVWIKIENNIYKFDIDGNIIIESDKEETEVEDKKDKGSNTWIIIVIIILGLIVIGISGFFIFKKKKTDDEDDNNNNNEEEQDEETEEEINEENLEENVIKEQRRDLENQTMNIDEALVDLMSTKQYNFEDEEK